MPIEVFRRLIDPSIVRRIHAQAVNWFTKSEHRYATGDRPPIVQIATQQSGLAISPKYAYEAQQPPGIWDFLPFLASVWTPHTVALAEQASIRRQKPDEPHKAFAWHQDAFVVGWPQPITSGFVYWIPLTDVDPATTPTLELATEYAEALPHHVRFSNGYIEATAAPTGNRALLDAKQGDVWRFPLSTPHRTFIPSGTRHERYSIDLRCVEETCVPRHYRGLTMKPY